MRDPLQVRRDEIHDAFRRAFRTAWVRACQQSSRAPRDLHRDGRWRGVGGYAPDDLPLGFGYALESITSATALIDVMLDSEHVEPGPTAGWPAANQRFSDWLEAESRDTEQKRRSIDVLLLSDLQTEIAEEAVAAWSHS